MLKEYTYEQQYLTRGGEIRTSRQIIKRTIKPKFIEELPSSITEEIYNYTKENRPTYRTLREKFGISDYSITKLRKYLAELED